MAKRETRLSFIFIIITWVLFVFANTTFTVAGAGESSAPKSPRASSTLEGKGLLGQDEQDPPLPYEPTTRATNSANTNSRFVCSRDGKDMVTEKHTVSALRPDRSSQVRPARQGKKFPRRSTRSESKSKSKTRSPLSTSLPGDFRRQGAPAISKQTAVVFTGRAKKRTLRAVDKLAIDQGPAASYLPKLLGPHAVKQQNRPPSPSLRHRYPHHQHPVSRLSPHPLPCHHHYRHHRVLRVDDRLISNVTIGPTVVATFTHGCQDHVELAGRSYTMLSRGDVLQTKTKRKKSPPEKADIHAGTADRMNRTKAVHSTFERNRTTWAPTFTFNISVGGHEIGGNFDPVFPHNGKPELKYLRRSKRSFNFSPLMLTMKTTLAILPDLKCLSMFLAGHKYFGFDARKGNQISWRYRAKGFHKSFPRPRLKKMHRDAVEACQDNAVECLRRLASVAIKSTILNNTVCATRRKMPLPAGASAYYPFESALDLFRFRTTATYYMCWHTMNNRDFLEHIKTSNDKTCLDDLYLHRLSEPFDNQKLIMDFRTDKVPFQCAHIAFCPDPCYGRKTKGHVPNYDFLAHRDPANPCRALRDQTCGWDMARNRNFDDLQRNRFNISCPCAKEKQGFAWNSKYHLCVDEDECQKKEIRAKCGPGKRCQNTVGGYSCMCQAGYLRHPITRQCYEHVKIARPVVNHSLTNARHVHKMLQAEGSGSFLERQIEAVLGLSRGHWSGAESVLLLICVAVNLWCLDVGFVVC